MSSEASILQSRSRWECGQPLVICIGLPGALPSPGASDSSSWSRASVTSRCMLRCRATSFTATFIISMKPGKFARCTGARHVENFQGNCTCRGCFYDQLTFRTSFSNERLERPRVESLHPSCPRIGPCSGSITSRNASSFCSPAQINMVLVMVPNGN